MKDFFSLSSGKAQWRAGPRHVPQPVRLFPSVGLGFSCIKNVSGSCLLGYWDLLGSWDLTEAAPASALALATLGLEILD